MIEKLQKIGFSKKESEIYLALAKSGPSIANNIAKSSSNNRTVTYNILQNLVDKGVVNYIIKDKKRYYSISEPKSLSSLIKEKAEIAKDLENDIQRISKIPPLSTSVETHEGKKAMRSLFEDIRKAKNLRVINATGLIFKYLEFAAPHIVKDIENLSNAKVIACQSLKKTPLAKFKHINFKYLPKQADNYATTFIFQNKVIIQILKDNPFLIKIENKEIFEGYKKDFDVLWSKM